MSDDDDAYEAALAEFVADFKARHPWHYDGSLQAAPASAGFQPSQGGSVLSSAEEEHLHGRCHLLAVALHEMTGLPLGAYLDEAWVETDDGPVEMTVLVHAFVVDDSDVIDVRGRMPLEDVLDEFDFNEPWLVNPEPSDLFKLGEGRANVGRRNPRFLEAKRLAEALVERLDLDKRPSSAPSAR